jgi:hypothetical protein
MLGMRNFMPSPSHKNHHVAKQAADQLVLDSDPFAPD